MNHNDDLDRDDLEHQRDRVLHRLTPVLDALAERRRAVRRVAHAALHGADAGTSSQLRAAAVGAVAGGALVAVGLWARHAIRARNRIDRRVGRALTQLAAPRRPSLLSVIAGDLAHAAAGLAANYLRDLALSKLESPEVEPEPQPVLRHAPPPPPPARPTAPVAAVAPVVVPPPITPVAPSITQVAAPPPAPTTSTSTPPLVPLVAMRIET